MNRDEVQLICKSADESFELGFKIGQKLGRGKVVSLDGPLGAGKTILAKGIAKAAGVKEEITSPTFTIISEYTGDTKFYHIDMYRIESALELEELGLEDIFYDNGITVMEWGEKFACYLPDDRIIISIMLLEKGERLFTIKHLKI